MVLVFHLASIEIHPSIRKCSDFLIDESCIPLPVRIRSHFLSPRPRKHEKTDELNLHFLSLSSSLSSRNSYQKLEGLNSSTRRFVAVDARRDRRFRYLSGDSTEQNYCSCPILSTTGHRSLQYRGEGSSLKFLNIRPSKGSGPSVRI